ncbi:MAG TPA: hypothetical protein VKU42_00085 [Candidatus Angelobacter sp.]|nr:hypothetical protein [Candidatus Angelobacter sp.]
MQEYEDFQKSVANVGAAVADAKQKRDALKNGADKKLEDIGAQIAQDLQIPKPSGEKL